MSSTKYIDDDFRPFNPRRQVAPNMRHDNRVGGRYVLPFDGDMLAHPEMFVREDLLLDVYPSLKEDACPDVAVRLDALVDKLPIDLRNAVELCVFGGLSFREAGKELGVYHKTVARRLRKALELMRSELDEADQ